MSPERVENYNPQNKSKTKKGSLEGWNVCALETSWVARLATRDGQEQKTNDMKQENKQAEIFPTGNDLLQNNTSIRDVK